MPLTHTKTLIPCFIAASLVATACSGGDDGAANNADPADMSSPAQDMPEGDAPDRDAPVDEDMREGVDPLSLSVTDDGPFQVGWRTYEHTYQPRPDGPERTITVNLFYPTEATDGAPARYFDLLADRTAFRDAPLADSIYDGGTYPVQLHSHGHTGYAGAEGPWLFHFVRHGWVVVAPEHTNNTLFDNVSPRQMELYYQRPLDVRAALDSAADLPDEDPLAGKLDTDRVILSGHSFGGFTTWIGAGAALDADAVEARCAESQMEDGEGCTAEDLEVFGSDLSEPRAVAAIPTAGTLGPEWTGMDGLNAVDIPVLALTGSEDTSMTPEKAQAQWERTMNVPMTWVHMQGGCHESFSVGNCTTFPKDEGDPIIQTYVLAFSRHHLFGDTSDEVMGILSGETELDARVEVRTRNEDSAP